MNKPEQTDHFSIEIRMMGCNLNQMNFVLTIGSVLPELAVGMLRNFAVMQLQPHAGLGRLWGLLISVSYGFALHTVTQLQPRAGLRAKKQ
jgi:hypothetical protein